MQPYPENQISNCDPTIEVVKALAGSSREGDYHLATQIVAEAKSRHRLIGTNTLSTILNIGGGYWIAATTRYNFSQFGSSIRLTGENPIAVGQPRQQMIAGFVENALYAIFDDMRYAVGPGYKMSARIGRFYSAHLDRFKHIAVRCSLDTATANVLVEHVRACAWRIGNGSDEIAELASSSLFMRELLDDQPCLMAA